MDRSEKAKEYFLNGYACSQAVVLAFEDVIGVDRETVEKIALPFGGGLGRQRLVCGAISGMAIVVGALFSNAGVDSKNKLLVYSIIQELCGKFKEEKGTLICQELLEGKVKVEVGGKPEERTDAYYKKRPCAELVGSLVRILEEYLKEKEMI